MLDTIPGVNQRGAELLVAESGIDMTRVGTAERLSAWSGVAPGNDESAGKQHSGTTRQRNGALRAGLTPLVHAAPPPRGPIWRSCITAWQPAAARSGRFWRVHAIVVSAFPMLSRNEPYWELGATYFDEHRRHQLVDRLARRVERLGYQVSLQPLTAA
jgi:transposase